MTPYEHAKLSVRDFGGIPEDYLEIHEFIDSTKFHLPSFEHRAVLHNSFGMQVCEQMFGANIVTEEGKDVSVREIARRHIMQDCGKVPTLKECLLAIASGDFIKLNKPIKSDLEWLKKN